MDISEAYLMREVIEPGISIEVIKTGMAREVIKSGIERGHLNILNTKKTGN